MPPKKAQKMSLNEFLGDSALGSWADEMDSLPNAPSMKADDGDRGGRYGTRDDGRSLRGDRAGFPPREDLPLPTQPPYTTFIGNLSFDANEQELEDFFSPLKTKSIKIIKDRDDRPKGFGYIEFEDLDGLKDALSRSGTSMSGRTIRVSVAEPPKERSGFGGPGGFDDEAKFDGPWRRDGPLPELASRDGSRRRFDGPTGERTGPPPSSVSDAIGDWRTASRPSPRAPPTDLEGPSIERRRSGFRAPAELGMADSEETWTKGSKFKPTDESGSRFGTARRGDMPPPREAPPHTAADVEDTWRSSRPSRINSTSPSGSNPSTPQLGRRKLDLLPKSSSSAVPSPLSSPRMAPSTSGASTPRSNPFGEAKPVDVSAKDKAMAERLDKDRPPAAQSMSRPGSHGGVERTSSKPASPRVTSTAASVRTSVSFANALGSEGADAKSGDVTAVAEKLEETAI